MAAADVAQPRRLLAGGGPSTPDQRVRLALTTPIIGQFDPAFTTIMDEVMQLARAVLLTSNTHCFPISALPNAGIEALLNTLPDECADTITVVQHIDHLTGAVQPLAQLAQRAHERGGLLLVDATHSLGAVELRTDQWALDAVIAGVDYGLGAPSGMTLVTYSAKLEELMRARTAPPKISYLDLLQLQAYWSPERLNHHTAPTSLVYGLREALRLVHEEGLETRWERHGATSTMLRGGLRQLGLEPYGDGPVLRADVQDGAAKRRLLLDEYGVYVGEGAKGTWRIGLLGADATLPTCRTVLAAVEGVLRSS
jgi:(S)-ureidoglycine---glyoxylate transaminase